MEYHIQTFLTKCGQDALRAITEVFDTIQPGNIFNENRSKLSRPYVLLILKY